MRICFRRVLINVEIIFRLPILAPTTQSHNGYALADYEVQSFLSNACFIHFSQEGIRKEFDLRLNVGNFV